MRLEIFFYTLLATLTLVISEPCPLHCRCYVDTYEQNAANCSNVAFTLGQTQTSNTIQALYVYPFHRLHSVKLYQKMFNNFKNIKYLNLSNGSITTIPDHVFYGLSDVTEIDLSFNRIKYINGVVFKLLVNLETLSLRGNPLHLTPMDIIVARNLRNLDIGYCGLRYISNYFFNYLGKLTHLSLDGNKIQTLSSLPKGLRSLNLSNNKIVNVPTDVISSLVFLHSVDLSKNPVNCTCHLLFTQDWLSGNGLLFENDIICQSPFRYRGIRLTKIVENELCHYELNRERQVSNLNFVENHDLSKRLNRRFNSIDPNYQADQASVSEAEILFSNDHTVSLGTHMESTSNQQNLSELIEGSGEPDDPTKINDSTKIPLIDEGLLPASELTELDEESGSGFSSDIVNNKTDNLDHLESSTNETSHSSFNIIEEKEDFTLTTNDTEININRSSIVPSIQHSDSESIEDIKEDSNSSQMIEIKTVSIINSESDIESAESTLPTTYISTESVNSLEGKTESVTAITAIHSKTTDITQEVPIIPIYTDDTEAVVKSDAVPEIVSIKNESRSELDSNITGKIVGDVNLNNNTSDDVQYSSLASYLVVALILLLIIGLIIIAAFKKKKPSKIRLPDAETNTGTELQDMDKLLPNKPNIENGLTIVPKANGHQGQNGKAVLQQTVDECIPVLQQISDNSPNDNTDKSYINDSETGLDKNNPYLTNDQVIQKTKAKLTILPDSIPKTPVFIHKNNISCE